MKAISTAVCVAVLLAMSLIRISAQGNVASATGSGQIEVGTPPEFRNFTFTARTDSSGASSGEWQLVNRSQGRRSHGTVDCLSVSGNVATIGGVVTDVDPAADPFLPGNFVLFQVIDNGEGSKAPPDLISLVFFYPAGSPNPGCTGFGIFATVPIQDGNVQVHGS